MKHSFFKRFVLFLTFVLPVAYIGTLVTVTVHEILGHGVVGTLLGGTSSGLLLRIDGFGAFVFSNFPESIPKVVITLLAGPFATLLLGALLLLLAWIYRKAYFISLTLLILSANLLLEGPPYLFWNAYNHVLPGDVGKVFQLLPSITLMTSLMVVGGLVTLISIIFINIAFVRMAERWFITDTSIPLSKSKRLGIFVLIFLLQAGSWFVFDWNLLAPGLGQIPNLVGVGITLLTLLILWFSPYKPYECLAISGAKKPILLAWTVLIISVTIILIYFQNGLRW